MDPFDDLLDALGDGQRPVALTHAQAAAAQEHRERVRALPATLRQALTAALCVWRGVRRAPGATATPAPFAREVIDDADVEACARVLRALALDPTAVARGDELRALAAGVARSERRVSTRARKERRNEARARERRERIARDDERARAAGIRRPAAERVASAPAQTAIDTLEQPRRCYACKERYASLHFFYDRLCPACAAFHWAKRHQSVDITGRVAIVTGARIRIGHAVALKLLRAGATVVATTRFPRDAARRFAAEPDFEAWSARLQVRALDLRDVGAVERFVAHMERELPRLDVLVNNAAQTVWRPAAFYEPLRAIETERFEALPEAMRAVLRDRDPIATEPWRDDEGGATGLLAARLSSAALFPEGSDDGAGQPLDLRETNSWRLRPEEVPTRELLETHTINTLAPFLLTTRLRALMMRAPTVDRWVIQVSAPEGSFDREYRSGLHAHTNMAKAALNMLVRTASEQWARDRVWMCAVDTGWVSNQNPHPLASTMETSGFSPPVDEVDAAARVLDPVFTGASTGENVHGVYVKDYKPASW